jgi:hypothetical protein
LTAGNPLVKELAEAINDGSASVNLDSLRRRGPRWAS